MVQLTETDRKQIDADFNRLEKLLAVNPLPTSSGEHRLAKPEEFMHMYVCSKDGVGFKHIDSRRYVYVQNRHGEDVLVVPTGNTFDVLEF